ncbi:MAG: methionyl-tRNA formyltransferase [Muribaculaceae bacterium]|nr:methionyl-tRNA formyltransferase [Muribaculaceae bacterium]
MLKSDLKIVFFGTPEFAVRSLDALVTGGYNVCAVVTMPDKIAGRGHKLIQSDVKQYAQEHNLPVLQPEKLKSPDFVEELRAIDADLFIVIAFRMLPEIVWQMPRLGTFNLHASLLPKYRGAAPINHAVMNGEKVTGITTFFLKHEIDTGDMIMQRSIEIGDDENVGSVHDRLMEIGAEAVTQTVESILEGSLRTIPQPEGDFTPAPKIFKDTCRIDWSATASRIHNHVRGLSPYPAAWTRMVSDNGDEADLKIYETSVKNLPPLPTLKIGEVLIVKGHVYVGTGEGPIEILSLQPAGKKRMEARAFTLGYHPVTMK